MNVTSYPYDCRIDLNGLAKKLFSDCEAPTKHNTMSAEMKYTHTQQNLLTSCINSQQSTLSNTIPHTWPSNTRLHDAIGRETDLRFTGRRFGVLAGHHCMVALGKATASVTKQYNLVPTKGRGLSLAGKVTAGLVESNDSLPPGL